MLFTKRGGGGGGGLNSEQQKANPSTLTVGAFEPGIWSCTFSIKVSISAENASKQLLSHAVSRLSIQYKVKELLEA